MAGAVSQKSKRWMDGPDSGNIDGWWRFIGSEMVTQDDQGLSGFCWEIVEQQRRFGKYIVWICFFDPRLC